MSPSISFHIYDLRVPWSHISQALKVCINAKMCNREKNRFEVNAWNTDRDNRQFISDWQFRAKDARIKLKRLYSKF